MPHWVEGTAVVYLVAAVAMGFLFTFSALPWRIKAVGTVFWPASLILMVWTVVADQVDR